MKEIIATGQTVELAILEACERLGISKDDASVEVLEMPQKKLFGMSPAKVKVTADDSASLVAAVAAMPAEADEQKIEKRPERRKEPRNDRRPTPERRERNDAARPAVETETETPAVLEGGTLAAFEYFKALAERLGATKITYEAVTTESSLKFKADGDDAALLIGRRGDTMEALQYLCSLVYNRGDHEYRRLIIDVANYRSKRERSLQQLARNTAQRVLRSKRSQTLEPMNPYERRIVHSEIQTISGVKSESVGEEPHRRVVIAPEGSSIGSRDRFDSQRGGSRRPGSAPAKRPQSEPVKSEKPTVEVDSAVKKSAAGTELPLYSKIEL